MRHRSVPDIMTTAVARVGPDTGVREIAALPSEYDITTVPVVDLDDQLVGILSEPNPLLKHARSGAPSVIRRAPRTTVSDRSQGITTRELMSSSAIRTSPGASSVTAARLMNAKQVERLPVVDGEGRLLGVVSRLDRQPEPADSDVPGTPRKGAVLPCPPGDLGIPRAMAPADAGHSALGRPASPGPVPGHRTANVVEYRPSWRRQ